MERVAIVADRLFDAFLRLAVVCGFLMTGFVVLATMMRYFVGAPFRFTEEIVGLLFVALAFLALPWTTLHNRHLRITLVPDRLPGPWRRLADLASGLLTMVFCAVFAIHAWDFAALSLMLDARTDMGAIPLFPWMALMPAMCVLAFLGVVLGRAVRGGAADEDAGPVA